jgi:hypothetical protein
VTPIILGLFSLVKGLAWPIVTLFVAISFKPEALSLVLQVTGLISRVRKLEVPGFKIEADAAEQQQKAADLARSNLDSGSIALKDIPGLTRTEAIANIEREIFERLKSITAEPVDVLVRNLAQARLEAAFGFIYAGIFGSQIRGLIALEARRKIPTDEAFRFYKEIEAQYPEIYAGYGFVGWIGFVKSRGLVAQVADDVAITAFGDDFLRWLQATQLTINKPY